MLGKLFGSKSRVKILKLFLSSPDDKFYIRQVARKLKLQLNSVRRELDNLEQFGLLTSNPDDNEEEISAPNREEFIRDIKPTAKKESKKKLPKLDRKYYQVNKNFILYEEIKALIIKAQVLYEKDFVQKLHSAGTPKLLILTGYFVGEPEKKVDMLIVGRLNKNRLAKLIKELEDELNRELNYALLNTSDYKFRRDITDVFLYQILEGNKLTVIDEFGYELN